MPLDISQGWVITSGAVVSGKIASGQVGGTHIASGILESGTVAQFAQAGASYGVHTTMEVVSGVRAVTFRSGGIVVAMGYKGNTSGFCPAIGVCVDNYLSGATCRVFYAGPLRIPATEMGSGAMISGSQSKALYLGASGQICDALAAAPPGLNSSGAQQQRLGMSARSGEVFLCISTVMFSGLALSMLP